LDLGLGVAVVAGQLGAELTELVGGRAELVLVDVGPFDADEVEDPGDLGREGDAHAHHDPSLSTEPPSSSSKSREGGAWRCCCGAGAGGWGAAGRGAAGGGVCAGGA